MVPILPATSTMIVERKSVLEPAKRCNHGRGCSLAPLPDVPLLSDAVLTGENRDYVGALAGLNAAQAAKQLGAPRRPDGELGRGGPA
jgi:hypothetical protein